MVLVCVLTAQSRVACAALPCLAWPCLAWPCRAVPALASLACRPAPPGAAYIEVPANTNCSDQGIKPVSADMCSHACYALGFKSTGIRNRANMSGCFVMTTGKYAGDCNYNANTWVTCTPPCQLDGAVVRALCSRN